MTAAGSITLWRCASCGKWSHAQRRPLRHERFIRTGEPIPIDVVVTRKEEPAYDHMNGFTELGGVFIVCGPFEEWIAKRGGAA